MDRNKTRNWRGMGCAAVAAAAIAFPLGLLVGGGPPGERATPPSRPAPAPGPAGRNPYSARVVDNPYVVEQQRRVLGTLEASCRRSNLHCAEAEQARRRIAEAEAGR